MSGDDVAKDVGLPSWCRCVFEAFIQQFRRQGELLNLSIAGITHIVRLPGVLNKLKEAIPGGYPDDENERGKSLALEEQASLARREVDQDFPLLRAQAVIALWGSTENLIRTLVASYLENVPGATSSDQLGRIKIRFSDWDRLSPSERYLYLLDRLEQEGSSGPRFGAAKFEQFLNLIGINVSLESGFRMSLIELHQVRNLIVHREGAVDRKFIESCPWLERRLGEVIRVTGSDCSRYFNAVGEYVHTLLGQLKRGLPMTKGDVAN